jgi:hypothetical protein
MQSKFPNSWVELAVSARSVDFHALLASYRLTFAFDLGRNHHIPERASNFMAELARGWESQVMFFVLRVTGNRARHEPNNTLKHRPVRTDSNK